MHISIIAKDKIVSVKGISLILEDLNLPKDLIAVHWFSDKGWEERRDGDRVIVKDIDSISQYQSVIDLYNEKYASIPIEQLPRSNMDLIDFVEDTLMTIEVMRKSDEWEEFKAATNRA